MSWPPKIPTMPPLFGDLFRAIIARLDAAWPTDGNGIRVTDAAGGGRSVNIFGGASGSASVDQCLLGLYIRDETYIGVRWGTINGIQPIGFDTQGKITAITITGLSYIYAKVTFDLDTWEVVAVEITKSGTLLSNTSTIGYVLLGAADIVEEVLTFSGQCGNVSVNVCDLADP